MTGRPVLHPWHDLPVGPRPPDEVNAFIEIPQGSRNKYELDKQTGQLRFDRLLYSAVHYPGDYGFIPRTLAGDQDPLDIVVMVTEPTFPGCLIVVRPLGVFEMRDASHGDEKILAVPVRDPMWEGVQELDAVPPHFLREVQHFFEVYKELEGTRADVTGWAPRSRAYEIIRASCSRYDAAYADARRTDE
jgi:inorganic pyrophosphatase